MNATYKFIIGEQQFQIPCRVLETFEDEYLVEVPQAIPLINFPCVQYIKKSEIELTTDLK